MAAPFRRERSLDLVLVLEVFLLDKTAQQAPVEDEFWRTEFALD